CRATPRHEIYTLSLHDALPIYDKLKQHVRNLMSTDMAREYKKLSKEHGQVKEKYSGLVERFNENVNDYNELLEENKSLKSKISDLKRDVSLIYESTKEF